VALFQSRGQPAAAAHSATQLLDAIRDSPPIVAALAAAAEHKVADRQRLIDTLAAAERSAAAAFPAYTAEIDAAVAAERKAEIAWRRSSQRVVAAAHARTAASVTLDRTRQQIEATLRQGADNASVADFLDWIEDEIARTSRQLLRGDAVQRREGSEMVTTVTTNSGSVLARLSVLREARTSADGLRLLADQSAVPGHIEHIRAALPPIAENVAVARHRIALPDDRQFGVRAA
jgi:hypothetical protein